MACGDVLDARRVMEAAGASELMGRSVAPEIDDGFDVGTAQMGPIWNPGEAVRARMKAGIRNITILYNTFQGIFTKMLFECEVKG
jgi:hypothetical protein